MKKKFEKKLNLFYSKQKRIHFLPIMGDLVLKKKNSKSEKKFYEFDENLKPFTGPITILR